MVARHQLGGLFAHSFDTLHKRAMVEENCNKSDTEDPADDGGKNEYAHQPWRFYQRTGSWGLLHRLAYGCH